MRSKTGVKLETPLLPRQHRTRHLTPAPKLSIPNVWVEELWGWSDKQLTKHISFFHSSA